jgi:class 3 adenylate cyclase/tetratricopeptide (TPR) repeat protein
VRCPACAQENREGARFCRACGGTLAPRCPACDAEAEPGSAFCDRCGARLDPEPARPPASYTPKHLADRILGSRAAIEGERKHVTVLFADCVGFTAIAEKLDPEDAHAVMDRCFEILLAQVHRYEGTVNQFTGDGVMALFGAPLALEDAPRRAVMAALGIQRAHEVLRQELLASRGIDLRLRIGINTGLVVVGKIGNDLRMDYTAVGDTTNLAARLQALAAPGAILVSDATHRLVDGFFETRDLGPTPVKGKAEPVGAFEVLAERTVRGRIDVRVDAGLTPLIGREREMASLGEAFASARAGQGRVVFLVGEAGIGKSRLLYEFRRTLGAEPYRWLEGRCASYGATTAFLPIADGLRRFFAIDDRDDERSAVEKVASGVAALGGDLAWTRPFLHWLLSLPVGDAGTTSLDAATFRSETFRALKAITLQAARGQPLVVVVEDLHWIDPASEDYLAFLADIVPATQALLVCSHRPGYRQPFGDRSYHVRVALQALSESETAAMTRALLGTPETPAELRALIARKADGNPFFVEEVTKSLLEEGVLRREDGRITLARDVGDVSVPDTIHDVLMARIDRLADDPKRAIQIASVIGREFALRLLGRITEAGERVSAVVEELRAVELIYEKAVHPELAYMFKHALTHDVAYESILVQRRKTLHRTIGLAIEELYADRLAEHYETLAHHFTRGEDWERALTYHEYAVEKAVAGHANLAVVEHCRQALAVAERLGDRVRAERLQLLEERLALAHFHLSDFRTSGEAYARAAERSTDPASRAINLGNAAHSFVWGHAYDPARRAAAAAVEIARAHGLPTVEAMAHCVQGFELAVVDGNIDAFERAVTTALRTCEEAQHETFVAMAQSWLTEIGEWTGDYRRALAFGTEAIRAGRRLRLPLLIIIPSWFMGKAACCLGDYGQALAQLQEAYDVDDRIGDRAWKTRLLNTLGWCYAEIGSVERARPYNERAAALAHAIGDPEIIANAEINLALNHLALGDVERARAHLDPIRDGLERGDPFQRWRYRMHLLDGLGRVALARGEPAEALALADDECLRARRHRAPKIEARALELRGRALVALEQHDDAERVLLDAVAVAERIAYPRTQWVALGLLAEIARRRGRVREVETYGSRRHAVVEALVASLPDPALQRELRDSAVSPVT